jgi:hypothetical protein
MTKGDAIKQALERMAEPGRSAHYVIVKDRNQDDYDWIPAAFLDDISYTGSRMVVEHLRRNPAVQAIQVLAGNANGSRAEAVLMLAAAVLEESSYGDPDNSLADWIAAGEYTGSETVESIAAEWDERDE